MGHDPYDTLPEQSHTRLSWARRILPHEDLEYIFMLVLAVGALYHVLRRGGRV